MLHILFFISLLQYLQDEELDAAEIPQQHQISKDIKPA